MSSIKQLLYNRCQEYVDTRIQSATDAITMAVEATNEDTKSSAGDKYETGREMMQQEIDRNRKQVQEAEKLKAVLHQIDPEKPCDHVRNGALVHTDHMIFYISISAGEFQVDGQKYMAISAASPLGLKMMNCKAGDHFDFNNRKITIRMVE